MSLLLLCGATQWLAKNISAGSPLRAAADVNWPARATAAEFDRADALFRRAARGHNLQLVIRLADPDNAHGASLLTQLYFRSVYALFPHRVLVGDGTAVVNGWEQLRNVSAPANPRWYIDHDIRNRLTLTVAGDGYLSAEVNPVAAP